MSHRCIGSWTAALLLAAGCSGTPKVDSPGLEPRAKRENPPVELLDADARARNVESFDVVWTTVRDKHWDPELGGVDWAALREELRPRIAEAKTAEEARSVLNRLVGALGQSHFGVYPKDLLAEMDGDPPETSDSGGVRATVRSGETVQVSPRSKRDRNGDGEVGFDIGIVDDQAVVTRIAPGSTAARAGVSLGWILAEIDGSRVATTIERFRESVQSGELELMLRHTLLERLHGDPGDEVDLAFLDARGNRVAAKLTLDPPKGERFKFGHLPPMAVEWQFERMGEVAYFRLSSFFDPARLMPRLREFIEQNLDAEGFIIDLRGNPGGIGFMANGICGLFVAEAGSSLGTMTMRDGELKFGIFPQATTYPGPLAVLIDGSSASTSEILAGGLRDIGRARLFGTRTAGAALPSVFERLPNGDAFQYAIANYVSAGGEVLEGKGVAPDREVRIDRKELLEGRDPVIEAAHRWIRERS